VADDVAQQAALVLLEAARAPAMRNQNGYLPIALARDFHKRLIRWAFGEIRQSVPSEEVAAVHPEPESDQNFEGTVLLEDFLSQWQRAVVLSLVTVPTPSKCASSGSLTACVIAIGGTADAGRCGCSQSKNSLTKNDHFLRERAH
jgi:hypothetical protein